MVMEDLNKKTVLEILDSSKEYREKLEELLLFVEADRQQVSQSAEKTILEIDAEFCAMSAAIEEALSFRREELLKQVRVLREEGLGPLSACQNVIEEKLQNTKLFIEEGQRILQSGDIMSNKSALQFTEQAASLGSLPAVPHLREVPDISFQTCTGKDFVDIKNVILTWGRIFRCAPVQITEALSKPGSLLLQWEEVDNEVCGRDIYEFRLQFMFGDIRKQEYENHDFHDVYCGQHSEYLVRGLRPGSPYSFRVTCRFEGEPEWSGWSVPFVAVTNKLPFAWDPRNENYFLTNDNKIATKTTNDMSILYSSERQFFVGHSIQFVIISAGTGCSDEGLALVAHQGDSENFLQPGVLFVNVHGSVFIDGIRKQMQLPPLVAGSHLVFCAEEGGEGKVRIHVESSDRTVTYDWKIDGSVSLLYFAACFGEEGWKFSVE